MSWPWKKKQPPEPQPCQHKYKDFPWYTESTYFTDIRRIECTITEPYVCVLCGHRKNIVLNRLWADNLSKKDAVAYIAEHTEVFANHMKPKEVVEDMIADMQLVDRTFLEVVGLSDQPSVPRLKT